MIQDFKSKQFIIFLLTGGFAAVVNFLSRFLYNNFTNYQNAIILAYITGMVTAFILAKIFVFQKSKHSVRKEVLYFSLVNLIAILQTYYIREPLKIHFLS